MKHSLATAGAIPATMVATWYLETLSASGIALLFVFFLAVFNGLATQIKNRRKSSEPD